MKRRTHMSNIRKIPELKRFGPADREETILTANDSFPHMIMIQGWTNGSIMVFRKEIDRYNPHNKWELLNEESERLTDVRRNLSDKSWNNFIKTIS